MAHILVVDDNPTNLKLVCDLLLLEGYTITRAINAEEVFAALARILPDMILMDIALPGIDGLTLTRRLKDKERTKHIPVVALTASAMKGDAQKAFDAGCEAYITKPIDTRAFPSQIASLLNSAAGARS